MQTDTLDKLYLEWSQFTKARTGRELAYTSTIRRALDYLKDATPKDRNGPCVRAIDALMGVLATHDNK